VVGGPRFPRNAVLTQLYPTRQPPAPAQVGICAALATTSRRHWEWHAFDTYPPRRDRPAARRFRSAPTLEDSSRTAQKAKDLPRDPRRLESLPLGRSDRLTPSAAPGARLSRLQFGARRGIRSTHASVFNPGGRRRTLPHGRPSARSNRSILSRSFRQSLALLPLLSAVLEQVESRFHRPSENRCRRSASPAGHLYDLCRHEKSRDPLIVAARNSPISARGSPRHAPSVRRGLKRRSPHRVWRSPSEKSRSAIKNGAPVSSPISAGGRTRNIAATELNLIAHARLHRIDHPVRASLALANFYRHEGLIDEAAVAAYPRARLDPLKERAARPRRHARVAYLI